MQYKFHEALVGGTFDRFHPGHKKLLTTAFEQSEKVTIGIATEKLFADKVYARLIEDYQTRKQSVSQFLSDNHVDSRATIVPIHDIYGTSLEDAYDAIFVTEETSGNALKINEERSKRSLPSLAIITVPFVLADDTLPISSERIRKGEIDRKGKSYVKIFLSKEKFILPSPERRELRRPIGPVYTDMDEVVSLFHSSVMLIAVGDVVSASLLHAGRQADISVIDGKTRRETLDSDFATSFTHTITSETKNPAGTITQEAVKTLQKAFSNYDATHKKQLIVVSGEEDLLAIPTILLAPLSSVVIYGQFDQGIVIVTITEQNKERVQNLFGKFQ
jgi:cytidyltransferase-like protein